MRQYFLLLVLLILPLAPVLGLIEIDNQAVFVTNSINYTFAKEYNLTGTLSVDGGRLDIDQYYVFNISADSFGCNISIIQLTNRTLEWNSSCPAGVTKLDNYLGNYTHRKKLYVNGTYDHSIDPNLYFVYFSYSGPTEENFLLNVTAMIQINVIYNNGTPVTEFTFYATNSTGSLMMVNSSPLIYDSGSFLGGISNITVSKIYSYNGEDGLKQGVSENRTTINNTGEGYIEEYITLYIPIDDIMGTIIFWLFMFILSSGCIVYGYFKPNYVASFAGALLSLAMAYYTMGLNFGNESTNWMMIGLLLVVTTIGFLVSLANMKDLRF